ncbi:YraN family protein [Microtetraspora malaysiensis]
MAAKDKLGRQGEELAAAFLRSRGLSVLARNWRCKAGDFAIRHERGVV